MSEAFPRLQVHDLHFAHPGRSLWTGWSAAWGPGVHALVGGDGAGKTSLLRLLAGQARPQGGAIALQVTAADTPLTAPGAACDARVFWIDPRQPDLPPPAVIHIRPEAARETGGLAKLLRL